MKIVSVCGAMPNYAGELGNVLKIVTDTLFELEVELVCVNLAFEQIPYYNGIGSQATEKIVRSIESANGVIFAATSVLYGIPAVMRAFLEYLMHDDYKSTLHGKNCMTIVCSHLGDERFAINEFSLILNSFGAFDSVKIGIPATIAKSLKNFICHPFLV